MRFYLFSSIALLASCSSTQTASDNYSRVARDSNNEIRQEIPVKVIGFGAMIPKQIHAYSMIFEHKGPIPIDLARCYALKMAEIILEKFNTDLAIQEFLEVHPFSINNVSFAIFSNTRSQFETPENYTDFVTFSFGKLSYDRFDISSNKTVLLFTETYEEALQKCTTSNCSIPCEK